MDYAKCVENSSSQFDKKQMILMKSKDTEVVLCCNSEPDDSDSSEFEHIAFVNGVYNKDGGTHVDQWSEEIFRPIIQKLNKPNKPQITIKDVKKHFRILLIQKLLTQSLHHNQKLVSLVHP